MLTSLLGSIGLGLTWGWLIGMLAGRTRGSLWAGLSLMAATLLLALETFLLLEWRASMPFLSVGSLAFLFHLWWRRALRRRFGSEP